MTAFFGSIFAACMTHSHTQEPSCCVWQATAHGELLYQQVPSWCLKWNYRWPGLLAEIVHYKPDVMSLQEVDHFDELAARLEPLGYVDAWHCTSCSIAKHCKVCGVLLSGHWCEPS